MQEENPIGFRFKDLSAGLATFGETKSRILTNQRMALETSRRAFAYLILTTRTSYRKLAHHSPECQIYVLGHNLRINPLEIEELEFNAYIDLLSGALRPFALSDKQYLLLHRILGNVFTSHPSPTLLDLLNEIRVFITRSETTDFGERRDAQFLERLVTTLTSGHVGACFSGHSHPPFSQLLSGGITILEMPTLDRQIHVFLVNLILAKVCAIRSPANFTSLIPPLVLLLDDADLFLVRSSRTYSQDADGGKELRHWQQRLRLSDTALHISGDHPSQLYPDVLGDYATLIVHRLALKSDLDAVQVPLKLAGIQISPYSTKRQSHHQRELLRTLSSGAALMTRPDLSTAVPIQVTPLPSPTIGIEFQDVFPESLSSTSIFTPAPTMLHKDFPSHVEEAARILSLLREYQLTPTAISEATGYDEALVTNILETLVAHRYIQSIQAGRHPHRRFVFAINQKGQTALSEYAHYLSPTNTETSVSS